MRLLLFVLAAVLCLPCAVMGDVIRMQNGNIFLGRVESADSNGISIQSFGEMRQLSQGDILKSEKNLKTLKDQDSAVYLKDGSIIKGKISDYDEEIGVLINIDFGTITVPVQSIKEINNPDQKNYYNGMPIQIGVGGGYSMISGKLKGAYNAGLNYSLFAEFNSNLIRGLFIGGDAGYLPFSYKDDTKAKYTLFTFQPYLMYRFFFLKDRFTSHIKKFVPFITIGGGIGYVTLKDARDSAVNSEKSEADIAYSAKAGIDYNLTENIIARISFGYQTVMQKKDSFTTIPLNAGILFTF